MNHLLSLCLLLGLAPLFGAPGIGELTLTQNESVNELSLELTPLLGVPSTDSTQLTGTVQIEIDMDLSTDLAETLSFTGGTVQFSDFALSILGGSASATSVTGTLVTPNPPAIVNLDQSLDASFHEVTLNSGTLVASGLINETINLASDPIETQGSGTGSITLTRSATYTNGADFTVTLRLPVDSVEPVELESGAIVGNLRIRGNIEASGTIRTFSSRFSRWAIEGGLSDIDRRINPTSDSNGDGIPDQLAWALGLSESDFVSEPLLAPSPSGTMLRLPASSTRAPLIIQTGNTLGGTDIWQQAQLEGMTNPIPTQATGDIMISPTGSPRSFFRITLFE